MRKCYALIVHDGASPAPFFVRIWQSLTTVIVIVLPGSAMFVVLYSFCFIYHTDHDGRYFI